MSYKTFLTITGGNGDDMSVIAHADLYDYLVVTPYIFIKYFAGTELEEKCIVFFNYFVSPYYMEPEDDRYVLQTSPWDIDHSVEIKIDWNPDDPDVESYSWAYPLTTHRISTFIMDIENFLSSYNVRGVLLDDHWKDHSWWHLENPDDYNLIHPSSTEWHLKTLEWILGTLIVKYIGESGILLTNGVQLLDADTRGKSCLKNRVWENPGAPYNPWSRIADNAEYGDFLMLKNLDDQAQFLTCFLGSRMNCAVNLGVPDGDKSYVWSELLHANVFVGPTPNNYPWKGPDTSKVAETC